MPADFDSPWKEAIEKFLRPLLELCFPDIARAIDWSAPIRFLDTELRAIIPDSEFHRLHVDSLIEVTLLDGRKQRILLHIEVQHWPEKAFEPRTYRYHKRLTERDKPVVTMVILADQDPNWRPNHYEYELLGCRMRFEFPTCKLLDLIERKEELEKSQNPAALLVLANWAAQVTGNKDRERFAWKKRLLRAAWENGYQREDIEQLFRLIDWLLQLPDSMEQEFRTELTESAGEIMPYVTSWERNAEKKGRQEGLQAGVRELLKDTLLVRFGELAPEVFARIDSEQDLAKLKSLHRLALTSANTGEFLRAL